MDRAIIVSMKDWQDLKDAIDAAMAHLQEGYGEESQSIHSARCRAYGRMKDAKVILLDSEGG